MEATSSNSEEFLRRVRAEFAANEPARLHFRALLDRGQMDWTEGWPYAQIPRPVPRTIWMYWEQGWDRATTLAAACRETWTERNHGWDVRALDRESAVEYADVEHVFAGKIAAVQARSDVLRLTLLDRFGGVWVDASTVCTKPLDDWLPTLMQSGFFAFAHPRPGRQVATWFLASEPSGALVRRWLRLALSYWNSIGQADVYLWCHYLFSFAYRNDADFAAAWDATPHVNAFGALQAQLLKFGADAGARALESIGEGAVPVFKLPHSAEPPADDDNSPLAGMIRRLLGHPP